MRWLRISHYDDATYVSIGRHRLRINVNGSALVSLYTKRWGYVCKEVNLKGRKPALYVSPDGTQWTCTYYHGPDKEQKVRSVIRKSLFGHNYDLEGALNGIPVREILVKIENEHYLLVTERLHGYFHPIVEN